MSIAYEQIFEKFSADDRQLILKRAEEIDAEINLRELRRLRKLTQARLSKKLKIGQEGISRIERRTDLYLSTLRSYVEGVGGKLSLVVEFPDQPPVILTGLGMDEEKIKPAERKKPSIPAGSKGKSKPKSRTKALQSA